MGIRKTIVKGKTGLYNNKKRLVLKTIHHGRKKNKEKVMGER